MSIPMSFEEIVSQMEPLLKELRNSPTHHVRTLRDLPKKGVYVFYENGEPMYVWPCW